MQAYGASGASPVSTYAGCMHVGMQLAASNRTGFAWLIADQLDSNWIAELCCSLLCCRGRIDPVQLLALASRSTSKGPLRMTESTRLFQMDRTAMNAARSDNTTAIYRCIHHFQFSFFFVMGSAERTRLFWSIPRSQSRRTGHNSAGELAEVSSVTSRIDRRLQSVRCREHSSCSADSRTLG